MQILQLPSRTGGFAAEAKLLQRENMNTNERVRNEAIPVH